MHTHSTSKIPPKAPIDIDKLRQNIISALKTVYDPELPVNIYELGLIYRIEVNEDYHITIDMTLTTPNCPEAQSLPQKVKEVVEEVPFVQSVTLNLVWDPPWTKDCMSEETKLLLGMF